MINYNKSEIREQLELEDYFELLTEFGGDPEYSNFGIISATICHNKPGEGSHKLYLYENSGLLKCFTGCPEEYFDIFELVIKVAKIQWGEEIDLNAAVRWVAARFGITGTIESEDGLKRSEDWKLLANYSRIQDIDFTRKDEVILKEYNPIMLDRLNYNVIIEPWLKDGISQAAINNNRIGYYPGEEQISIPHFDINGRFIGLRGRALVKEEAEKYGKYRPIKIGKQLYNHPLGMNLYNLNNSKEQIKIIKKAIVFESEKSCLQYQTYFGIENDISVACCGSNLSTYQMELLLRLGVEEVVIAFDKQYEKVGTSEYLIWQKKVKRICIRYSSKVRMSYLWDTKDLLSYKSSPTDEGKEKFLKLFQERKSI